MFLFNKKGDAGQKHSTYVTAYASHTQHMRSSSKHMRITYAAHPQLLAEGKSAADAAKTDQ